MWRVRRWRYQENIPAVVIEYSSWWRGNEVKEKFKDGRKPLATSGLLKNWEMNSRPLLLRTSVNIAGLHPCAKCFATGQAWVRHSYCAQDAHTKIGNSRNRTMLHCRGIGTETPVISLLILLIWLPWVLGVFPLLVLLLHRLFPCPNRMVSKRRGPFWFTE